jgi:hypothetical protein
MTINDLKGDLQKLAIKRRKEHLAVYQLEFDESDMTITLAACFVFSETEEGMRFWNGVCIGEITELPK